MEKSLIGTMLRIGGITEEYADFLQKIGMTTCQLYRLTDEYLCGPEGARRSEQMLDLLRKYRQAPTSLFAVADGGIIDPARRTANLVSICRQMNWAKRYGIRFILCHAGELPEQKDDFYQGFLADLRQLAAFAAENQQYFLFETGPMRVEWLQEIFTDAGSDHLGMNFDPANMMYYNVPNSPDDMVEKLGHRIMAVHCKDAVRPGKDQKYGKETILGEGDTGFVRLIPKLVRKGFTGPLIIEREIPMGPEQRRDISNAVLLLKSMGL